MKRLSISMGRSDKKYFAWFEPTEIETLEELGELMCTHSLSSQLYGEAETPTKSGKMVPHRKAINNIVAHGDIVNMDIDNTEYRKNEKGKWIFKEGTQNRKKFRVDNPVTLVMIESEFKCLGWGCVITHSKSSTQEWEKFHISAFTAESVPGHAAFALQYIKLCNVLLKLQFDTALKNSTQNLTPAVGRKVLKVILGKPIPFHSLAECNESKKLQKDNTVPIVDYNPNKHNLHLEGYGAPLSMVELIVLVKNSPQKYVRCGCFNDKSHGGNSDSGCFASFTNKGSYICVCKGCDEKIYLTTGYALSESSEISPTIYDMIDDKSFTNVDIAKEISKIKQKMDHEKFIQALHKTRGLSIVAIRADIKALIKEENREAQNSSFPHYRTTEKGELIYLSTADNMEELLKSKKIDYYYDLVKKNVFVEGWVEKTNWKSRLRSSIMSHVELSGLPRTIMDDHYVVVMMSKVKNPLLEHIKSSSWDGNDHIVKVVERIKSKSGTTEYRYEIFKRWLVQCVAAWDGAEHTPRKDAINKYETIFVLGGNQGVYKTSFFNSLMPGMMNSYLKTGALLRTDNKDDVKQLTSYGMVELGELEATFKKSDIADLKAFTSRTMDEYRVAYGRDDEKHKRRTSFCASVNTTQFLNDPTGARRFAYIAVEDPIDMSNININQLWSQVYALYIAGERWWFESGEEVVQIQREVNNTATDNGLVGDAMIKLREIVRRRGTNKLKIRISATALWKSLMGVNPSARDRAQFYSALESFANEEEFKKYKMIVTTKHGISIPGAIDFDIDDM